MQNQILGFFIITCVCLGILCGAQWRQLREKRSETNLLKGELADQSRELDGKATAMDTLKREQKRLTEQLTMAAAAARTLETATNSLMRQLDQARRYAIDMNGKEVGPLGTFLKAVWRDPVLADRLLVQEFRAELEGTPNPLSDAQTTELLDLLAAERREQETKSGETADPAAPAEATQPIQPDAPLQEDLFEKHLLEQETFNRRVLSLARDLFLPEQLEALARSQTNLARIQQYGFEWGRQRAAAEVPDPAVEKGGNSP